MFRHVLHAESGCDLTTFAKSCDCSLQENNMAFIDYISYEDASDKLKALYDQYKGPRGTVANIVRIAGPNPAAMKGHMDMYRAIMFGKSPLSRHQREMIAVVVSSINQCHY